MSENGAFSFELAEDSMTFDVPGLNLDETDDRPAAEDRDGDPEIKQL